MDWFEQITGFEERGYAATQALLKVEGDDLVSAHSSRRWGIGQFETPTLGELRARVGPLEDGQARRTRFRAIVGEAGAMHRDPANGQALFQVASQFNALEMVGPSVSPEDGVTRYATDKTQGPACAIAAGAATIFRNYLLPLPGGIGQTRDRQVDGLHDIGAALGNTNARLWRMENGYALATPEGLAEIDRVLQDGGDAERDRLKSLLRIGLHWNVQVTTAKQALFVSQAFCSALPVRYSDVPEARWERFARLVLEAAYEATLLAGVLNQRRTGCDQVYLTRLGGGAFGNPGTWIHGAIQGALQRFASAGLDVCLVSYGAVSPEYRKMG